MKGYSQYQHSQLQRQDQKGEKTGRCYRKKKAQGGTGYAKGTSSTIGLEKPWKGGENSQQGDRRKRLRKAHCLYQKKNPAKKGEYAPTKRGEKWGGGGKKQKKHGKSSLSFAQNGFWSSGKKNHKKKAANKKGRTTQQCRR